METQKTILDVLLSLNVDRQTLNEVDYRQMFRETILPELAKTKELGAARYIRVLETPVIISSVDDAVFLEKPLQEILNGEYCKIRSVETFNYNPLEDDLIVSGNVMIYDIFIGEKKYRSQDLPCGMWLHPTRYDENTFAPIKKLEFSYKTNITEDLLDNPNIQQLFFKEMLALLKSDVSNIPYDPIIHIRCIPENIKITKKQNTNR